MNQNRSTGAIPRTSTPNYVPSNYDATIQAINKGLRVAVIMRGLPGSGKSYLAKKIIADTVVLNEEDHILSTDNYFMRNGRYEFDPNKLSEAHASNQNAFIRKSHAGVSPLIVDNTNMEYWEMNPYLQTAVQYEYHIEIMEPSTPWKWKEERLAQNNKHGVPIESLKRMKAKYQTGVKLEELLKLSLNLDIVKEPKMRNIPPLNSAPPEPKDSLISFSMDNNANKMDKMGSSLFQWNLTEQNSNTNPFITFDESKKPNVQSNDLITLNWDPPPRIFEDNWELPDQKEITTKEKTKENKNEPLPQRKVKKNKKPSSPPSSDSDFSPHRKDCINENKKFAQLRELYPNINDKYIWDLFIHCKGDPQWCANILCDEDKADTMDAGNDLNCDCGNADAAVVAAAQSNKNPKENGKKQTPCKSKKMKTDGKNVIEMNALKTALEENVKISDEFYPDHVKLVKAFKQGLAAPQASSLEKESFITDIPEDNENDVVALSIDQKTIEELDATFGGGSLKHMFGEQSFPQTFFIKSSTASRLYYEIKEAFISHEEEVKLQLLKNDLDLAKSLQEQEKVTKYSILYEKPSDNLADIMKTQAALKDFENDMNGWQKTDKTETIAQKLSKEKLFQAFPNLDKNDLISVYKAMDYNFDETLKAFYDSLNLSADERKKIDCFIESKKRFEQQIDFSSEITAADEETENVNLKTIEELRLELAHHREAKKRCNEIAREHLAKKNFEISAYYRNMANLHHQFIEEKEQYVANLIADVHMLTQEDDSTLNLHFFSLVPAKNLLNTFLDTSINHLREVKKPYTDINLITGRGAHSINGVPLIKLQTIEMLKKRNLKYVEVNPGFLRVKIFPNSILSSDIDQ